MIRRRPLVFAAMAAAALAAAGLGGDSLAQPAGWANQAVADQILVEKAARKMTLFSNGRPVRSYRIALGRGGLGAKQRQGDGKVPEGRYYITGRNPVSSYHLALRIGYPTSVQADQAAVRGVDPGGDIMIHGLPNHLPRFRERHRREDWTEGCIAVTNEEIEEIWQLVPDWAIIEIRS
jgi:murein L,D-transpeptidase YafK